MKKSQKLTFCPIVNFDPATNQFEILLNELGMHGRGVSKQDAVDSLLDVVKDSTLEFFYNFEFYFDVPEIRKKYPYFLSFGKCKTKKDLLKVLNLKV
jgi:hypothetical protein